MNKKTILILKLLLTSVLLIYIFSKIPFEKILNTLSTVELPIFISAVLITIPVILLSSLQTKYLTAVQNMVISFIEIVKIYLTTSFYSLFLPGALSGGAVKWYKFSKFGGKSSAAAIVVFNRLQEIVIVSIIGIGFSLPALFKNGYIFLLSLWIVLLFLIFTGYIILLNESFIKIIEKVIYKIPFPKWFKKKFGKIFNSVREFQNLSLRDHLEMMGIIFLYNILGIIVFFLLALSLNITVDFITLGWIRSVIFFVVMLPISYSGLGSREVVLIYLLGFYGVPPNQAVALSFLFLFKNLFFPLVGGIWELKDFLNMKVKSENSGIGETETKIIN